MSKISLREKALLTDALAQPADRREAFLAKVAGTDPTMRARLLALVAAHEEQGNVLDVIPLRPPGLREDTPGCRIDRYTLLEKIGEGGCGVVWRAEQQQPVRRRVALKLIKLGMDTKAVLARFDAERQALAMMDHPNIAKVLDGGASAAGRPYFVMELVRGIPITHFCDQQRLRPEARLRLFLAVCHAVRHAHAQNVIHRDLKPANILVTVHDGEPVPKVIDFGIAKATQGRLTDATLFTAVEQFIGTPAYMSPEQAELSVVEIDRRSDVYSLGVLLYELLTGRLPFDFGNCPSAGMERVRQLIREHEPPKPSTRLRALPLVERTTMAQRRGVAVAQLSRLLRGDLDWIVMKCLEKERARRYPTVSELTGDLERYLRHEPVSARPPSVFYVVHKAICRHRTGVVASVALGLALAIGAAEAFRAQRAERRQEEFRRNAAQAEARETAVRRAAQQQQLRDAGIRWARETALPEITDLIKNDDLFGAFQLARRVEKYIPGDPALTGLWPQISTTVTIETASGSGNEPAPVTGADVYIKPYRRPDTSWQYLGKSPLPDVRVGRDVYRWKIEKKGYIVLEQAAGWYLFYWGNPTKLTFLLEPVGSTPPGMVRVERRIMSPMSAARVPVGRLDDFWIDRYEVTNREFKEFVDRGGYVTERFWKHEFVLDGTVLKWSEAIARLRDSTARPGPATWNNGTYIEGEAEHPVTGLSWYEAAAYAEFAGKRLPSIYHWQNAAVVTHGGFLVPLSNFGGQGPAPVGYHQGMSRFGAYDLAGNAAEWCWNEAEDGGRHILGGGWNDPVYMFAALNAKPAFDRSPSNGFRCIKLCSGEPLPLVVDAPHHKPPLRIFANERPVSDEAFVACKRWFAYDQTGLQARTEAADDTDQRWRLEKVSFNAAYNEERIPAWVFLPRNVSPPYQAVLLLPGVWAQWSPSMGALNAVDSALVSGCVERGRAVIYPTYKGTYERRFMEDTQLGPAGERDWYVQVVKDVGRTIDYLETRDDIQIGKVASCGYSWGVVLGVIASAVEPRIQVNVFVVGGFFGTGIGRYWSRHDIARALPEVDQINFAPRVMVPTLMLNGRYDPLFPLETSQRPMFQWLGTPAEHKRQVVYATGHDVPMKQVAAEIHAWLDRYLGEVK